IRPLAITRSMNSRASTRGVGWVMADSSTQRSDSWFQGTSGTAFGLQFAVPDGHFAAGPCYLFRRSRRGFCAVVTRVLAANHYWIVASGIRRVRFPPNCCRTPRTPIVNYHLIAHPRVVSAAALPPSPRCPPDRLPPLLLAGRVLS